jgi:hypothetical protein
MTAAFHRAIWTKHSALLAIFVLAVILMLPAFVRPPIFRDSWWIDDCAPEQDPPNSFFSVGDFRFAAYGVR